MSGKEVVRKRLQELVVQLEKYKYVLLILLAGILLLLLPGINTGDEKTGGADPPEGADFNVVELERKLEDALSQVDGAGDVSVVLTVKGSSRQILAQDVTSSSNGEENEEVRTTVVISQGSGQEKAVSLQQVYPSFQGALVVCPGGENAQVRLKLVRAVSALTGLGADRISICKSR